MEEILYLEPDEEITSVVDKLKGLDSDSVGLVAPKGSSIVQSLVSLKLLKKQAEKLKKDIAIITSDEVGRNLAGRVGLAVYDSPKSKEPIDISDQESPDTKEPIEIDMSNKQTKGDQAKNFEIHRYDDSGDDKKSEALKGDSKIANDTEEEKEEFVHKKINEEKIVKKDNDTKKTKKFSKIKKAAWIVVPILLLVLLLVSSLLFTKLDIAVAVPADEIQKEVDVKVEKDRNEPDLDRAIIPGKQFQEEKQIEDIFQATGEKNTGEKSTGNLTFKNESGVNETVEQGATLVSTTGKEFIMQETITVPKASLNAAGDKVLGQTTGKVQASDPGSDYNLSSASFSVYGKSRLSVTGSTSGGVTRVVTVISQQDLDQARTALEEKAKTDLQEAIKVKNSEYTTLTDASKVELNDYTTTKNVGEKADEFKASANAKMIVLAFNNEQLHNAALAKVEEDIEQGEDAKGLLATDTDTFSIQVNSGDINTGIIDMTVTVDTHAGPKLNFVDLKKDWKGKALEKVRSDLNQIEGLEVKGIKLSPSFGLPYAPILSNRINVEVEYIKQ